MERSKSEIAIHWIAHGMIQVHLDPRLKEVIVPLYLRQQHSVVLEWGFSLPRPIPDMKLDADAISGTLSFPGDLRSLCIVPWSCVFALSSPALDLGKVWPDDMPSELRRELLSKAGKRANEQVKAMRQHRKTMKGHLRVVKKGTDT
jgi:hypothetical protein